MAKNVLVKILADTKQFQGQVSGASTSLESFSKRATDFGKSATVLGAKMTAGLTLPLALAGKTAFTAASDMQESMSKIDVVFGKNAKIVTDWSKNASTALGLSQQSALEAAGTYGNLFQAFGLGQKESQKMSTSLVELAADLASFNNTSTDDALAALQSGLSGETEPLKKFGVALSDVRLKDEAMKLGIIKTTKEALTPAAKAQASYSLIMKDTALAQGDYSRTSQGAANRLKTLTAQFKDASANIGSVLLPIVIKVAGWLAKLAAYFNNLSGPIKTTIVAVALIAAALGPLITLIGSLSTAIGFLTSTIGIWVAIIAVLVIGFVYLYNSNETFKNGVIKAWEKIKQIVTTVADAMIQAWDAVFPYLKQIFETGKQIVTAFIDGVSQAWEKLGPLIMPAIKSIGKVVSENLFPALKDLGKVITKDVIPALQKIWKQIKPVLLPVLKVLGAIIGGVIIVAFLGAIEALKIWIKYISFVIKAIAKVISVIAPFVAILITGIVNNLKIVWEGFQILWNVISTVWNAIAAVITYAWNTIIKPIWDLIWSYIQNVLIPIWTTIFDVAKKVWDGVWNAISTAWGYIKPILEKVWDYIQNTLVPIFQKIWDKAKEVWDGVWSAISTAVTNIKAGFEKIKNFIGDVVTKFTEIPGKITGVFKNAGTWLVDTGKDIIQGLIDGAGKLLSKLGTFFLDKVPEWIKGPFKKALGIKSPSKLFAGFGGNIVDGLVDGLKDTRALDAAMNNLSSTASGGFDVNMAANYAATTGAKVIFVNDFHFETLVPDASHGRVIQESLDELARISA